MISSTSGAEKIPVSLEPFVRMENKYIIEDYSEGLCQKDHHWSRTGEVSAAVAPDVIK